MHNYRSPWNGNVRLRFNISSDRNIQQNLYNAILFIKKQNHDKSNVLPVIKNLNLTNESFYALFFTFVVSFSMTIANFDICMTSDYIYAAPMA